MDVPTGADAGPDRLRPPPRPAAESLDVDGRLRAVEAGLARLTERLDTLAGALDRAVHQAVATEVQAAAGELRHSVSELGRILVRDVGKLPHMLARHRDEIVAGLQGGGGSGGGELRRRAREPEAGVTSAEPVGAVGVEERDAEVGDLTAGEDGDGLPAQEATGEAPAPPLAGPDGEAGSDRGWRERRRRRRPE
jgi:hypothetical protein